MAAHRFITRSLAASAVIGLALQAARAADPARPPSPERGKVVAERLCSTCHLSGVGKGTAQAGLPTFPTIANRPGQTATRIRNALIKPHGEMPDLQLTNEEIADIIVWLDTLRDPKAPPLLPRDEGGKPQYPEPT